MKHIKIISLILAVSVLFAFAACGKNDKETDSTTAEPTDAAVPTTEEKPIEMLAVYFPYDETSEKTAKIAAEFSGARLFALETVNGYPKDEAERAKKAEEEAANNDRPALKDKLTSLYSCSVVFVCTPLWEGDLPMAFYTFFDEYDLRDRIIVPLCVSSSDADAAKMKSLITQRLTGSLAVDGMAVSPDSEPDKNAITAYIDKMLNG